MIAPTNNIGTAVTHRYCAFHILMSTVVPMQSAKVPATDSLRRTSARASRCSRCRSSRPRLHNEAAAHRHPRPPIHPPQRRIEPPAHLLDEIAPHARARIDRRQNKQRLEHQRKLIPIGHQPGHTGKRGKNRRHADRERHGPARPTRHIHLDELREFLNP